MNAVSLLLPVLQKNIKWNKARLNFLAQFLIALFKVKTVNLTEIAVAFNTDAKIESSYKRIQRFFRNFVIDFSMIAELLSKMLPNKNDKWILTSDRTNWKFGKININIFLLAIAYKGIAFPIFWIMLPKRGNSNTNERIQLLNLFLNKFSVDKIKYLTGDREFLGKDWFDYLEQYNIPFRIRIRENMKISNSNGIQVKASHLFRNLALRDSQILFGQRLVNDCRLFVVGKRLVSGFLILVTNYNPENALEDYSKRWEIETLFSCLKTRGFRFEETHLTKLDRIEKLIAILAIAFIFAHITGEWLNEKQAIKIKKHGRKAKSFFRYGLDYFRKTIINFCENIEDFYEIIQLFDTSIGSPISI